MSLIVAAIVVCLAGTSGCRKSEPSQPTTKPTVVIGYSAPEWGGAQFQIMQGLRRRAEARGWTTTVLNANFDVHKQEHQLDYLISAKPNAIVAVPLDSERIGSWIDKSHQRGILFYTIDRAPSTSRANMIVQANNEMAGRQVGEAIAALLKRKYGEVRGSVLELRGELTQTVAVERDEGFHAGLASDRVEVLHRETHWQPREFALETQRVFDTGKTIDAIYMHSDMVGVPEVLPMLRRLGKLHKRDEPGHILLGGVDGGPPALRAIRDGYMDVCASQPLTDYGIVADWIARELAGESVQPGPVVQAGAAWSPARIIEGSTGPRLQLATTPVTAANVDDRALWGNQVDLANPSDR